MDTTTLEAAAECGSDVWHVGEFRLTDSRDASDEFVGGLQFDLALWLAIVVSATAE